MDTELTSIKTTLNKEHRILFAIAFALLIGLSYIIGNLEAAAFIIPVGGLLCYYIIASVCKADAEFQIINGNLNVSISSDTLNVRREKIIALNEIRGFNISDVRRNENALFIYLNNFECIYFNLFASADKGKLLYFLGQHLNEIDKSSNPKYTTFSSAYLFALGRCFAYLAICLPLCLLLVLEVRKDGIFHQIPFVAYIGVLVISIICWRFLFQLPLKKNYFRYLAYLPTTNFFIYLSPLLLFFIVKENTEKTAKVLNLNYPSEIEWNGEEVLYTFKEVGFNPEKTIVSDYIFSRGNRKSRYDKLTHYFLTPITNGETMDDSTKYWFWVCQSYEQKVPKRSDYQSLANNFRSEHLYAFAERLKTKPTFYRPLIQENLKQYSLIRSNVYAGRGAVILEPYWESLQDYRNDLFNKIIWLIVGLFGINVLWCLYIASQR